MLPCTMWISLFLITAGLNVPWWPELYTILRFKNFLWQNVFINRPRSKSKAPWAAHGWIVQSQVYFCPGGETSRLSAKLLVSKYMSPVQSLAWKSSDFHDFHGKRLAQAFALQMETQTVEVEVCIHSFLLTFYKNVVFPAQAEYSYFSADFRLKTFLYYS